VAEVVTRFAVISCLSVQLYSLYGAMMVDIMDIIFWLLLITTSSRVSSTPLDDYVNRHDPTYTYSEVGDPEIDDGYTLHYINLTSQTWLTDNDSDRSIWWHYLVICIPHDIELSGSAFMYITGGSNSGTGRPDKESVDMLLTTALCITTGSVTAALFQIPNQPIVFTDDPIQKRRSEDAIIAYTWYHYMMRKQDPEWLLRLPMTKAAVRAMDTISDFTSKKNTALNINKFVVAGASKRGWTTWTTGAVDDRVIGIIPIVMDLLNMKKNLHHHYRSLGGWTFAFGDYYEMNITKNLDSPLMQDMADIVDPYSYIDHLTMPKLIISSSGDEFFLPDDNYYFLDDIKGETHIRVLPNDEHSCAAHAVGIMFDARAFYLSLVQDYPRPKMTWTLGQVMIELL
jgi:PhoPQ-activated pathogenicity-related protein